MAQQVVAEKMFFYDYTHYIYTAQKKKEKNYAGAVGVLLNHFRTSCAKS